MKMLGNDINKSKIKIDMCVIYAVIIMAIYILPYAKLKLPYIPVAILMLSSIYIAFKNNEWFNYASVLLLCTAFLTVINLINGYGIIDCINEAVRNVRYFIPTLLACYMLRKNEYGNSRSVVVAFFILSIYIMAKTLIALEEEPWIARILAQDQSTSTAEINAYRLGNVGGYPFSYMMGIVTVFFAWLAAKSKHVFARILCVFAVIVCFYYIIKTMYTTLLILTTISVAIVLWINMKNVLLKTAIIILMGFAVYFLPIVLETLSATFGEESLLSTKFIQMSDAVSGEGVDALGSRPGLMVGALKNFIRSPIFGGVATVPSHSTIMECLQQNGIFGLAIWLGLYISSWKMIGKEMKNQNVDITLFNIVMFYLIALAFFNDTRYTFEITIAAFFITPIFSAVIQKKEYCENGKKEKHRF